MLRSIAPFAGLTGIVLGVGATVWVCWPTTTTTMRGERSHFSGSTSVVHLDGEGRPIVPSEPAGMNETDSVVTDAGAAAVEDPPLPVAAPGGGEMVVVGQHLQHYSVARRGGDADLHVGCEGNVPLGMVSGRDE